MHKSITPLSAREVSLIGREGFTGGRAAQSVSISVLLEIADISFSGTEQKAESARWSLSSLWGKTLNMGDVRECSGSAPIPCESPCSLPTPLLSTGLKSGRLPRGRLKQARVLSPVPSHPDFLPQVSAAWRVLFISSAPGESGSKRATS